MNCIIVDDEPLAREAMKLLIEFLMPLYAVRLFTHWTWYGISSFATMM